MSVEIEIDLKSAGAADDIMAIKGALIALDDTADDIDLGENIDADKITGELGAIIDELGDTLDELDKVNRKFNRIGEDLDIPDEVVAKMKWEAADGDTGSGDSTGGDPPSASVKSKGDDSDLKLSKSAVARRIENVAGFEAGSVDIMGEFDRSQLNEIASDIENTTKGLTSDKYPWVSGPGDSSDLGASAMPKNFQDQPDLEDIPWNPKGDQKGLQQLASEAGVYGEDSNLTRDEIIKRLRTQQFGGKGINVDSSQFGEDYSGPVNLKRARRMKQGAFDFPEFSADNDYGEAFARFREEAVAGEAGDGETFELETPEDRRRTFGNAVKGIESIDDSIEDMQGQMVRHFERGLKVDGFDIRDDDQLPDFALERKFIEGLGMQEQADLLGRDGERGDLLDFDQLYDSNLEGFIDNSDIFSEDLGEINKNTKRLLEESGLDPDKVDRAKLSFDDLDKSKQNELIDQSDLSKFDQVDANANRKKWADFTSDERREILQSAGIEPTDGSLTKGRFSNEQVGFNADKRGYDNSNFQFSPNDPLTFSEATHEVDLEEIMSSHESRKDRDLPDGLDGSKIPEGSGREKFFQSNFFKRARNIRSTSDAMNAFGDGMDAIGKKMRGLRPTMGKYMQLLAALIPIAVALGTQLLGVAAAMGAVGAAGAGIIGLGLLGSGDSMAQSVQQAKEQIQTLKEESFQAFQPTMQQFAPIQSRMFEAIPGRLDDIAESMEGLKVFEGTLFQIGAGLSEGFERAIGIILENKEAIHEMTLRFGSLLGSGLLDFFEWLLQSASENQRLLIELGKDMLTLVTVFFNLSMAVANVVTAFSPMFKILLLISELMQNEILLSLIQIVGWMYALGKVVGVLWTLGQGFMVAAGGINGMIIAVQSLTGSLTAAYIAAAALIGVLTIGAGLIAGGIATTGALGGFSNKMPEDQGKYDPSGSGMGSMGMNGAGAGSGGTVVNDNREFTFISKGNEEDYGAQKRFENKRNTAIQKDEAESPPGTNND